MLQPGVGHQGHAVFGAGDQHGAEAVGGAQEAGGGVDGGLAVHRHLGGFGQFAAVGGDDIGAGVAAVVAAFRVHHHPAPGGAGGGNDAGGHVAHQHALVVVRQHGDGGGGQRVPGDAHQALGELGVDGGGDLVVGAQQLLALGDVAGFGGGGAAALHQQPWLHVGLPADQPGEVGPGLVIPHHGDEGHRRAQCGEVAHHVAGAAGHGHVALDRDHGDGRFGRDAVDHAVDVAVEHGVPNDEHAGAGKPPHSVYQVGGGRCGGRRRFGDHQQSAIELGRRWQANWAGAHQLTHQLTPGGLSAKHAASPLWAGLAPPAGHRRQA